MFRWFRYHILSRFSVIVYLNTRCSDWQLELHDWPTWYTIKWTPYKCIVRRFWDSGLGIGRTPMQAARRAVRHMGKRSERRKLYQRSLHSGWE